MDKAIIVSGGLADDELVRSTIRRFSDDTTGIISADSGLNVLYRIGVVPDVILGDFDSVDSDILDSFRTYSKAQFYQYPTRKNFTDTELATDVACNAGAKEIIILGGTGYRMDHTLGVLFMLQKLEEKGVRTYVVDPKNVIRCLLPGRYDLHEYEFGKYLSLIPLTDTVTGVTLKGVSYETDGIDFVRTTTLGISNEITKEEAYLEFKYGTLLLIKSQD